MEDPSSNLGDSTGALASRRKRTVWDAWQQEALLTAFARNPYPSFRARQDLASEMGLPESRIRVWFQNRRNRTRDERPGPEGARGGRRRPEEGRTRLRTRLSPAQQTILLRAFEKDPRPTYDARVKLAQETGLPEDTIHIWCQNRRARHPGGGRGTAGGQDSLALGPPPPPPQLSLPLPPPPRSPQPSPGPTGEPEGAPCGWETEQHAQHSLLPPAAALVVGVQTLSPPSPTASFPASPPAAAAQPSGPCHQGHPEPNPVAGNTFTVDDVELMLDQLLTELQAEQEDQDTLDPHVPWEDIDPTLDLPLDQQEYQTLLLDLL
ncbi:double homeobox protein 4-like [Onychomys torridus]|uniref:double homeobox protein 4-like n=1 Tax=Onychomys torridus TaxID=38674 RepID=UPI00167FA35D|nr:double homeobox protein 4-like [Onychomys torridus]XP_036032629.1 double homeobox protein 4-like [Onychomys torridus]